MAIISWLLARLLNRFEKFAQRNSTRSIHVDFSTRAELLHEVASSSEAVYNLIEQLEGTMDV